MPRNRGSYWNGKVPTFTCLICMESTAAVHAHSYSQDQARVLETTRLSVEEMESLARQVRLRQRETDA